MQNKGKEKKNQVSKQKWGEERQTSQIRHGKTWIWLQKGNLKIVK